MWELSSHHRETAGKRCTGSRGGGPGTLPCGPAPPAAYFRSCCFPHSTVDSPHTSPHALLRHPGSGDQADKEIGNILPCGWPSVKLLKWLPVQAGHLVPSETKRRLCRGLSLDDGGAFSHRIIQTQKPVVSLIPLTTERGRICRVVSAVCFVLNGPGSHFSCPK